MGEERKQFTQLLESKIAKFETLIREKQKEGEELGIYNPKQKIMHKILGYLPMRGEFENEFDHNAEVYLADMEFEKKDTL